MVTPSPGPAPSSPDTPLGARACSGQCGPRVGRPGRLVEEETRLATVPGSAQTPRVPLLPGVRGGTSFYRGCEVGIASDPPARHCPPQRVSKPGLSTRFGARGAMS